MGRKRKRSHAAREALLGGMLVSGDKDRERSSAAGGWRGNLAACGVVVAILGGLISLLTFLRESDAERLTALLATAEHLGRRIEDTSSPTLLLGLEAEYQETLDKIGEIRDRMAQRERETRVDHDAAGPRVVYGPRGSGAHVVQPVVRDGERDRPPSAGLPRAVAPPGPIVPEQPVLESALEEPKGAPRDTALHRSVARGGPQAPVEPGPPLGRRERARRSPAESAPTVAGGPCVDRWLHAGSLEMTLETPPLPAELDSETARRHRSLLSTIQRLVP